MQPDSFYTRSVEAVIPNFIFGTWFIYVKTNARETGTSFIYEGALNNNNLGQAQLQVFLTPTPKLTVQSLNVPVNNASTTQPVGINWTITNEGFTDNIEKNKGHIITMSTCQTPCPPGSPRGSLCAAPSVIKDSIVSGSSYWIDRVYLSTDPGSLNVSNAVLLSEVKHGVENSGLNVDAPPPFTSFVSCPAIVNGHVNVDNVIQPRSVFPKSLNFTIPANLSPGTYYVYVYTNPTKTVFEYPGTPEIRRSILPIVVQRPDVTVPAISVPGAVTGGQPVTISYQVLNNGPGAVFNHIRHDRIYISNAATFDGTAQLIGTNSFTEDLPVGTSIPKTFTYNMPPATNGMKYFYVITNFDSSFKETNYVNNLSAAAATLVSAAVPADFVVSSVQAADSVFTVYPDRIIYRVTNGGSGPATGTWTDSVFISCNPVFNPANSYFIGRRTQSRTVPASGIYLDTLPLAMKYAFEINACFPEGMFSNAYFYVKANADSGAYEGTAVNNNVGGSGNRVLVNPLVDHVVTTVNGPANATVGSPFPINWRLKNAGYNPGSAQLYNSWYEAIYFSTDSVADQNDIIAAQFLKYLRLNRNQDTGFSTSLLTPNMPTGGYYAYVYNNNTNSIRGEKVLSNNVNFIRNPAGAAQKIQVFQPPLSDLVDTIVSAPTSVAIGQPITVVYKITNRGTGVTFPGSNFQNQLLLSADFLALPNSGDRLLSQRNRVGALPPGGFYYDTVTAFIPASTIPGNYVLISQANSNNVVMESNLNNNLGFSLINVFAPPVTDITVSGMVMPDTAILGYTIDTAKWVVTNISGQQARGRNKDGIYLSAGNLFDSSAVLLGLKDKDILMQPLQSDTVRMAPMVTGVPVWLRVAIMFL